MRRIIILAVAVAALSATAIMVLPGGRSAEERAQDHFERAETLLEEDEVARALVELRNVFRLDGKHREARIAYARAEEGRGNPQGAYSQYLRLVEQYPDSATGHRALARIAVETGNWQDATRHHEKAAELIPEDPVVRAVGANLDYRAALRGEDEPARADALDKAKEVLAETSDQPLARRLVIDDLIRRQDWEGALAEIDKALANRPDARGLYAQRLGVLERLGRPEAIEAQYDEMLGRFPGDARNITASAVRWYLSEGRADDAESFLRDRLDSEGAGDDMRMALVRFLAGQRGAETALAELDRIIAAGPEDPARFRSTRASIRFETGARAEAISEMRAVLEDAEPSDETDRIRVALARMLERTGDRVGARAQVETVLENDPAQVGALKLRAGWRIENDRPGDALVDLNSALDQAPRDAGIPTLMARAHARAGNRELQGEMLSRAVEISGNAPAEALRYGEFLSGQDNLLSAESVLLDALRQQPGNIDLLGALGNVYVGLDDWPRLQGVIDSLREADSSRARAIANELTARRLAAESRIDELTGFLEGLAEQAGEGLGPQIAVIRARLADGDIAAALERTRGLIEDNPEAGALRFIEAQILAVDGQREAARQILTELIDASPRAARPRIALYRLHAGAGELEQASDVLDSALEALPENPDLLWAKAGELERAGNVEEAIAIYERLYEANSNSVVVANNLASLMSSHREGQDSLERAYTIARRLRGTEVPAFQDTYGWIAFRLGNHEEALNHLEPAAEALAGEPIVQYHLARAYAELERTSDALARYRRVVELVDAGDGPRPDYMATVEDEIARLESAVETGSAAEN